MPDFLPDYFWPLIDIAAQWGLNTATSQAAEVRNAKLEEAARLIQPNPNASEYIATMLAAEEIRALKI